MCWSKHDHVMKMYLHSLWTERDSEVEIGVGEGGRKGERAKEKKVKRKLHYHFLLL